MSIVYQNDFESQHDNWSSSDLVTRDASWGFVSPSNSLRWSQDATLTQDLGFVSTIRFQYNCSMWGFNASYFDALSVQHTITLPGGATCDTMTWNDTGDLTINDNVTALKFDTTGSQSAADDLIINGLTVPGGSSGGFSTTTANQIITDFGSSMYDNISPLLPLILGFLVVSSVVLWAFNKFVEFFKRR